MGEQAASSGKRPRSASHEEQIRKVKKTIGWYNKHGMLNQPIIYKTVASDIENGSPSNALKILKELDNKAATIANPTFWLKKAVEKAPELDKRVKTTIAWYNNHGNLAEPIHFDEVKVLLSSIDPGDALRILKGLDGAESRTGPIQNPTSWICKAVQKKREREDWYERRGFAANGRWTAFPDTPAAENPAPEYEQGYE